MTLQVLTLWDSAADPSGHSGLIYRWTGYSEGASIHSLMRYVEINADRLRGKYLAWIHDLGESRFDNKRLVDHLVIKKGFSYWWMTLLVEKSPWKSPSIIDALRLLALEEIIVEKMPEKLRIVSANENLHYALQRLCRTLDIDYEWNRLRNAASGQTDIRSIFRRLPQPVQAIVSLTRYVRHRWSFRHTAKSEWFGNDRSVFLCSYFIHLNQESCAKGHFYSHHWETLPKLLHDAGYRTNWIQYYSPSDAAPSPQIAISYVRRFNQQPEVQGRHSFLDAYLSWRVVLRVLKHWLRLLFLSSRLRHVQRSFQPFGSNVSLWPLMRQEWTSSMRGAVAISNLLWLELFDEALRDLPHQNRGLYLYENQAFERALIHAWRKWGHGQLVAVAHSTVRFWDLRYFTDPRTLRLACPHAMPKADLVALNGKAALDAYLDMNYPQNAIVQCEALRYGYLNHLPKHKSRHDIREGQLKVIILGEYTASGTRSMLKLLVEAVPKLSLNVDYFLKPHPNFMVQTTDYPALNLTVVQKPLAEILPSFDVAYSSNMTSAAVDAYLVGLPVIVMLDGSELNYSPLRGRSGTCFVSTPDALAEALQRANRSARADRDHSEFFFLNPELPRWKRLLEMSQ